MFRLVYVMLATLFLADVAAANISFQAVSQVEEEKDWSLLTQMDLTAIHQTLKFDHPAALLQVDDLDFIKQLNQGFVQAQAQALQVANYDEYRAVLNTYTARFDDLHIATQPVLSPEKTWWPGFIVNLQGDKWMVNDTANTLGLDWIGGLPKRGMELVSCDGVSANQWAKRSVGTYMANWSVEAQRERFSPWLFNGELGIAQFYQRPRLCVFSFVDQQVTLPLNWQQGDARLLTDLVMSQPVRAKAGFGISKLNNGYWISLEKLHGQISQVVTEIERYQHYIREAEFVVLDVRGNHGGDSRYAHRIAVALYGEEYAGASIGKPYVEMPNQTSYRVSKANLKQVEHYLAQAQKHYSDDLEYIAYLQSMRDGIKEALSLGLELAPAVPLSQRMVRTRSGSVSSFKGQVLLLTDNACFSSCLLMTDLFMRLGALQVGRTTNAMPRYYDSKQSQLPSGLSTFVTMTKVDFGAPKRLGPFKPRYIYDGDMNDTQRLKNWVLDLLAADRD